MSTRAHIRVFGHIVGEPVEIMYYHHSDGYPSYLGKDLKNRLASSQGDLCLFKDLLEEEGYYEINEGIHGDEAFLYIVDYDNKSVKCYDYSWDETLLETIMADNVIPEDKWENY